MKKQTTALVLSLFIVLVLTGVMVFLMVRFRSGEEQQEPSSSAQTQEDALLALSSNQINTVTITNPDDSFTLVNQGNGFVVEGLEEIAVSNLNVSNLISYFQRLSAKRELADLTDESAQTVGASREELEQYGLDEPGISVEIVTTDGKKETLLLGSQALDNSSVYLLYQQKVYLVDDGILDSVRRTRYSFLDNNITEIEPEYEQASIVLSGAVRPSPITLEIKTVTEGQSKSDDESSANSVAASKQKEYTLTTPLVQTISQDSAAQVTKGLFSLYANAIAAVEPTPEEMVAFGLDEPYSVISVRFDGAEGFTLKTSEPNQNHYVYLMRDGSPLVYLVSASRLSWLSVQTEQLTQSIYQPVEAEALSEFRVTAANAAYDFTVSKEEGELRVLCNGQEVSAEQFEKLYQAVTAIPPVRMTSKQPELSTALTMTVSYQDEQRSDDVLELVPTGTGEVYLVLNDESRYTAQQDLVSQILENCQKVLEGKEPSNLV